MDLEMTGLDVKTNRIMEISCLITDNALNIQAECPTIIINQPDSILHAMDEWNTTTHTKVSDRIPMCNVVIQMETSSVHRRAF